MAAETSGAFIATDMSFKPAALSVGCLIAATAIGWGRVQIRLIVPNSFRGVIRVAQGQKGEDLRSLFPRVAIPSSGVVTVKHVSRFLLLLSVSLMTAALRASESQINEVIHAPRDGSIVLDGRPVIYIVIDAGQPEATYVKSIFYDIYSRKSFRRIYFRTKLNLAEIKDVKPTSIWLFGSFATNIANVGDVPVAAYAALPATAPPARNVGFPVGLLLVKGSELTPRWRNWGRPTSSVVLFVGRESGALKTCIGELISKTEEHAMQLHR